MFCENYLNVLYLEKILKLLKVLNAIFRLAGMFSSSTTQLVFSCVIEEQVLLTYETMEVEATC